MTPPHRWIQESVVAFPSSGHPVSPGGFWVFSQIGAIRPNPCGKSLELTTNQLEIRLDIRTSECLPSSPSLAVGQRWKFHVRLTRGGPRLSAGQRDAVGFGGRFWRSRRKETSRERRSPGCETKFLISGSRYPRTKQLPDPVKRRPVAYPAKPRRVTRPS